MALPLELDTLELDFTNISLLNSRGRVLETFELPRIIQDPTLKQELMKWMEAHPDGINFKPDYFGFQSFLQNILKRAEQDL